MLRALGDQPADHDGPSIPLRGRHHRPLPGSARRVVMDSPLVDTAMPLADRCGLVKAASEVDITILPGIRLAVNPAFPTGARWVEPVQ